MSRKDTEKDSDRPHYYSQFWLDIAAGRRTIGGPKPDEEGELLDDTQEPLSLRRSSRNEPDEDLDDASEFTPVRGERPAALTRPVSDDVRPTFDDTSSAGNEETVDEGAEVDDASNFNEVEDADIPDVDFSNDEEEDEDATDGEDGAEGVDEDFFEEDEDEDDGWVAGRGRKKPSPKRAVKPTSQKRPKRDTRRSF